MPEPHHLLVHPGRGIGHQPQPLPGRTVRVVVGVLVENRRGRLQRRRGEHRVHRGVHPVAGQLLRHPRERPERGAAQYMSDRRAVIRHVTTVAALS
jgi:hypothetical protein